MKVSILMPNIDEVSLMPNPIIQNSSLLISIKVSEITMELLEEEKFSGEFDSGEV